MRNASEKIGKNTLIFYPIYCFDCSLAFIGKEVFEPCPYCKRLNVVDYKGKIHGKSGRTADKRNGK